MHLPRWFYAIPYSDTLHFLQVKGAVDAAYIPPSPFPLQAKGAVDAAQAAVTVSGLELGGLVGGTLAGVLSDMRIRRGAVAAATSAATDRGAGPPKEDGGNVGRRVQIIMVGGSEPCSLCTTL